jgi:hypothetical protein
MSSPFLKKLEMYSLSNDDLHKILGPVRIITYPDLEKETLDTLFKEQPYVIILFLTEDENTGHWQCMLKREGGKQLEVFDSFGVKVDGNRKWLSKDRQQALDQTLPNIHNLVKGFPGELVYNNVKLQEDSRNTCGRHIASRILHDHLSIQDYIALIERSGIKPDEFVTLLTYRILHK